MVAAGRPLAAQLAPLLGRKLESKLEIKPYATPAIRGYGVGIILPF